MAAKASGNGRATAASKGKTAGLTKMDAVRQALIKLGRDAGPTKIRDYVKAQFGIEMSVDHVSNCKSEIQRRAGKKQQASVAKASPAKAMASPGGNATSKNATEISVHDVLAVKDLVGRVGAGHLKTLIDAFSR